MPRLLAPFAWYGGKYYSAMWINQFLPSHGIYVEPYVGAGSVFWNKAKARIEVLNDANSDIVNLFQVLRDRGMSEELQILLETTPYSREEFTNAIHEHSSDKVQRAMAFMIR